MPLTGSNRINFIYRRTCLHIFDLNRVAGSTFGVSSNQIYQTSHTLLDLNSNSTPVFSL